jgi:hypothetical protein
MGKECPRGPGYRAGQRRVGALAGRHVPGPRVAALAGVPAARVPPLPVSWKAAGQGLNLPGMYLAGAPAGLPRNLPDAAEQQRIPPQRRGSAQ